MFQRLGELYGMDSINVLLSSFKKSVQDKWHKYAAVLISFLSFKAF